MSQEYDAFGRPVQPPAPPAPPRSAHGGRSYGAPGARAGGDRSSGTPRTRPVPRTGDAGDAPVVRGLPSASGGDPTGGASGRRRSWAGRAGGFAVAALVVLGIVGSLADSDDGRPGGPSSGTSGASEALTADAADDDVLRLREAMRPDERVLSVSLGGGSASARTIVPGGGTRSLTLDGTGGVRSFDSTTAPPSSRGVPLKDLDTSAPGRLVAAVGRGLGPSSAGSVRSVTAYSYDEEPLRWTATVQGAPTAERSWSGDEHGEAVVRVRDGAPAPAAGQAGPATVPTGVSGRSLLVPENLGTALVSLAMLPETRDRPASEIPVGTLDVRPSRILAAVRVGGGRRLVSIDAAFGVDPSSVDGGGEDTVALRDIDREGPARALRTIGRRLSTDAASRVENVTLTVGDATGAGSTGGWFILLGEGAEDRVWRASMDGRLVGRSGEELSR